MNKSKIPIIILIAGLALIVLSFALTWLAMQELQQGMGIIGGADAPTAQFLFSQHYSWLAMLGAVMSLAGAAWLLIIKLRNK